MAEPLEQVEIAGPLPAEAEVLAGDDDGSVGELGADELLRLLLRDLDGEVEHGRLGHPELREQLQPPLEGRDRLDEVAQDDPRVRVKRQHPHREPGFDRRRDHPLVTQVHAVERPDRDSLGHGSSASASSAGITRSSSASSTLNGPISSRRSVVQWPPSASAIART